MISGATGAVAAVIGDLVREHDIEYLFYAVILMGLIQMLLGVLKADTLVRLLPYPVVMGFCNGLSIVIFRGQLDLFKHPHSENWITGSQAIWSTVICLVSFL